MGTVGRQLYCDYPTDDEACQKEEDIAAELERAGLLTFEDVHFFGPSALYRTPQDPPRASFPAGLVCWNRLSALEVSGYDCPIFLPEEKKKNKPHRTAVCKQLGDLRQGGLPNRWFISALNSIAAQPTVLKQIVVSSVYGESLGLYTMKFFKEGAWRYVHIDDRLPCDRAGRPLYSFTGSVGGETWGPLIEKAYAKLSGCYENLSHGCVDYGLRDLSGLPVMRTVLSERESKDEKGLEEVAQALEENLKRRSVVTCYRTADCKEEARGLKSAHAYPLVEAKWVVVEATALQGALRDFLVKLRNPWEGGDWSGDWANEDMLWRLYPQARAELWPKGFPESGGGGKAFWMSLRDVLLHFSLVFTAQAVHQESASRREGKRSRKGVGGEEGGGAEHRPSHTMYKGRWLPGDLKANAGGGPRYDSFVTNPQYPFVVEHNHTTLTVAMSRRDHLWTGSSSLSAAAARMDSLVGVRHRFQSGLGFVVVRIHGTGTRISRFNARDVVAHGDCFFLGRHFASKIVLPSGRFVIVPCTLHPGDREEWFRLELWSDKGVDWEQQDKDAEVLGYDKTASAKEDGHDPHFLSSSFPKLNLETPEGLEMEGDGKRLEAIQVQMGTLSLLLTSLKSEAGSLREEVSALASERQALEAM